MAGSFLATLAQALARRGHEIRVVAPSDGGETGPSELEGIAVRRVRYAEASRETLAYRGTMAEAIRGPHGLRALYGLWKAMRDAARSEIAKGAELIHAHWWIPAGVASPPETRMVLTVHGTDAGLLRRSAIARRAAAPVFRRARVVTVVSQALGTAVTETLGLAITPGHVQPMPTDTSRFTWSSGGGGAVVVARLTAQKRVDLAVRTVAELRRLGRALPLTVVGEGPERANLNRLVEELELQSLVRFKGAVAPAEVPTILARSDVMLFPSRLEGFGLAAAESFMAGVPVVACHDGGGVTQIVPSSGAGRIVDPTPSQLADAVASIVADPHAPAAARMLGAGWRQRLSPDAVARICEGWYREAMSV